MIDRFSEDIDLNIDTEGKPTESQRKQLKVSIVSIIESFGFALTNAEDVYSRRAYNKYIVDFPTVFDTPYLKEHLIVETSVYVRAYPSRKMEAASMIYDYLKKSGFEELIERYELKPFELKVQTAQRTLIDKVYALGDYYLDNKVTEHSRHIYDLHKLLSIVELEEELKILIAEVAEDRKGHASCLSAQDGVNM